MNKKKNQIEKVDELTPNKVLDIFIPILGAVFIAVSAIFYVLYKSWSAKVYFEKWKDYEDCGV